MKDLDPPGAQAGSVLMLASVPATLALPFVSGHSGLPMVGPAVIGALWLLVLAGLCRLSIMLKRDSLNAIAMVSSNLMISYEIYESVARTSTALDLSLFYLLPIMTAAYYRSRRWWVAQLLIACGGRLVGLLATNDPVGEALTTTMMVLVAFGLASAVLHRAVSRTKETQASLALMSQMDPLTGVLNRRGMENWVNRNGADTCALIMVDVDHFKQINDDFGHEVGDDVLSHIAAALTESVRHTDAVVRLGGEEFLCILPGATIDQAKRVIERVASGVRVSKSFERLISASFGVTFWDSLEVLGTAVRRADGALYAAKSGGRDQARYLGAEDKEAVLL